MLALLSFIRNMTWNGLQGFQTPIEEESFLVDDMGVFGHMHTERNLTCKHLLRVSRRALMLISRHPA